MGRNVLNPVAMQFRNFPVEEAMLVAVNDAAVGNDDRIERVNC